MARFCTLRTFAFLMAALLLGQVSSFADEPAVLRMQGVEEAMEERGEGRIPGEDFISGPFSEYFLTGDYPRALEALESLQKEFPADPLITRYRAITLDRMEQFDQALAIYDELLKSNPNHAPTRFFRAQTYYRMGRQQEAIEEWRWVQAQSPSKQYRNWSREYLDTLEVQASRTPERRRAYLFGNIGWEYDSNVTLLSNDEVIASAIGGDQNAGRFPFNLGLGYRIVQKSDLNVDFEYITRQSFNDDSLNEYNFTSQEFSLDARKRTELLGEKDLRFGAKYDLRGGWLDDDLYSVNNILRLTADARLTPLTRTYVFNRFEVSDYGRDGSDPPTTSRDNFEYDAGVTHYFYSEDFRSFFFVGQQFGLDAARGDNFDMREETTRIGWRWPVPDDWMLRTDLDASVSLRFRHYPDFISDSSLDTTRRRNHDWIYYVALTHRFRPRLRGRLFYRHTDANSRNDIYQYDRHVGGAQLLFTQYF